MSDRLVFRSLQNPSVAYTVHRSSTDLWDSHYRSRHASLACWAGQFEVYNDFPVQHSPEYATPKSAFVDYCASLALAASEDETLRDQLGDYYGPARLLIADHAVRRLEFFQSLRYSEAKTRFYHPGERKPSSAPARQHDKRWHEVPSWADGSAAACHRFMVEENADFLESFALYAWLWQRISIIGDGYAEHPALYFKLNTDEHKSTYVWCAFEALLCVIESSRTLARAKTQLSNYLNWRKKTEPSAA